MNTFIKICKRELCIQLRDPKLLIHASLFLLTFMLLFPLTIKPEAALLRTIVPGLVWIGTLLSFLLASELLFQEEFEQGVLESWVLDDSSFALIISAKIWGQWLLTLIPLLILCPMTALFYHLSLHESAILALSLILGSPALLFLCALTAAFGVGLNTKGVLMALILLPLSLPLIIFGAGTLDASLHALPITGLAALLLAFSLLAAGFIPLAIAAVLKEQL